MAAQTAARSPRNIRLKTRVSSGWHRLPFVTRSRQAAAPNWHIPASGGYRGGLQTGEAMAIAFLKFLRTEDTLGYTGFLAQIVQSFMARFQQENQESPEFDSLYGQFVGFFGSLCESLQADAQTRLTDLDAIDDRELVTHANAGLRMVCMTSVGGAL